MGQNQVILRHQKFTFPRVSGASERANGRASGPVLTSLFLFVPDHSDVTTSCCFVLGSAVPTKKHLSDEEVSLDRLISNRETTPKSDSHPDEVRVNSVPFKVYANYFTQGKIQ